MYSAVITECPKTLKIGLEVLSTFSNWKRKLKIFYLFLDIKFRLFGKFCLWIPNGKALNEVV